MTICAASVIIVILFCPWSGLCLSIFLSSHNSWIILVMLANTLWNTFVFYLVFFRFIFIFISSGTMRSRCTPPSTSDAALFVCNYFLGIFVVTFSSLWRICLAISYPNWSLLDSFGAASTHLYLHLRLQLSFLVLLWPHKSSPSSLSLVCFCCSLYILFVLFH